MHSRCKQDYAVDPDARNDMGLFFLLSIDVETKKCVVGALRGFAHPNHINNAP